ncbi:DUF58 domain-containing protein [Aridibaculum aurantiacum]|uniref:DUF58 domain-containing protein n=1 Tax=Aridibaculum aurantiacum TaxID=2810307 RepID=UPI001F61C4FA|nr:DUF58 domain-containing protein [Aridibaculum aurantiacum]
MKQFIKYYIGSLFLTPRLYGGIFVCVVLFVTRFFIGWLGIIPYLALLILLGLFILDYLLLYTKEQGIFSKRTHAERFSNGDENAVRIDLENRYGFDVQVKIIDEIPHQFQRRDVLFQAFLKKGEASAVHYSLRPVKRGSYNFGSTIIFVNSSLNLLRRRYKFHQPADVPVYPGYLQMRKYQLMAISNRLNEVGVKKVRRLGHSMEFEQIKEYVQGDDYRTVNWKATARKGQLMVNNFTDEKSQQVYCVIDKGRVMKSPFEGLSLMDYAINASLVLSNVALTKQDKAGIITFSERAGAFLTANKKATQMHSILELLYNQKTRYLESDFEQLYINIRRNINQRSLIVLFTNFESLSGMRRHLPYLRKIAQHHLLLTVFFENTELQQILLTPAKTVEDVYVKTVAEKFAFEKRQIAKELQQYGILSILTPPQQLTINTINKYLELKARQAI